MTEPGLVLRKDVAGKRRDVHYVGEVNTDDSNCF